MQDHLNQAVHNQRFHNSICDNFNDNFHDWKITVLFYTALHWLQALASMRGINIGDTHVDIEKNVNPDRTSSRMKISKEAWRNYKMLFRYSQTSRYDGITDFNTWHQIKKKDHSYCEIHLEKF